MPGSENLTGQINKIAGELSLTPAIYFAKK